MKIKKTQEELVTQILKEHGKDWTASWELVKVKVGEHFLGTSGDRAARRMAERGDIERKHEGNVAYYRIKQAETAWSEMFGETKRTFNNLTGEKL